MVAAPPELAQQTAQLDVQATRTPARHAEYLAVAVIVGLAAYLRLAYLQYAQFGRDDSALWLIAWSVLRDHAVLLQGMEASLGVPNGPFQAYLVMLPMFFSSNPLLSYVVVALLNVAGVYFTWRFCRSHLGSRVALVAALLLAINPWAVIYSRRLWGNDMTAPFTILLIWALCDLAARGRRRDSFLPVLWLVVVVQLYVVAFVHLATTAVGAVLAWRRIRLVPLAAAFVVGLALIAPYAFPTVLPNLGQLGRLNAVPGRPTVVDLVSLGFAFHIVGNEGYQAFANQAGRIVDMSRGLPGLLSVLAAALLGLGSVLALFRSIAHLRAGRRAEAAPYVLGLIAVFLPPLLLTRHAAPIYPYYELIGFPMHFVLMGVAVDWLLTRRPRLDAVPVASWLTRGGTLGLLGGLLVVQLIAAQAFFTVIREYWPDNDYGMNLTDTLALAHKTESLFTKEGAQRLYVLGGHDPEVVLSRVLHHDGLDPLPYDSANLLVAPRADAGKVLYVLAEHDSFGARPIAEHLRDSEVGSYTLPGSGLQFTWFASNASRTNALLPPMTAHTSFTFGDAVRLDGYALTAAGDSAVSRTLTLNWTVLRDAAPGLPQLSYYLRLEDNDGHVYQGLQRYFYGTTNWRAGDRVSMLVDFPVSGLPPGQYWLLTGLFSIASNGSYANLPIRDAAGGSPGEGVRLGPLYVHPTSAPQPTHRLGTRFGDAVTLEGYDLRTKTGNDQRQLAVTLYWGTRAPLDKHYTVFVHLLDPQGRLVAQHDGEPDGGRFPTTGWAPGDVIVDPHTLPLPTTLAPGRYTVEVGLYATNTGVRLGGNAYAARFTLDLP